MALYLSPLKPERLLWRPGVAVEVLPLTAYFLCLSQAPTTIGTPWLFPMLFTTRLLLFAPSVVLKPAPYRSWWKPNKCSRRLHNDYQAAWITIIVFATLLHVRQSLLVVGDNYKNAIWEGFRTINDNPAVSALAYDYIIALASLYVFWAMS